MVGMNEMMKKEPYTRRIGVSPRSSWGNRCGMGAGGGVMVVGVGEHKGRKGGTAGGRGSSRGGEHGKQRSLCQQRYGDHGN
ncbi:unnamed protein product, partial [Nesidiocoris tenuis]